MEVKEVIEQRGKEYGSFLECAQRFCELHWFLYSLKPFAKDKTEAQVLALGLSMICVKLARLAQSNKQDIIVDIHGYCSLILENICEETADKIQAELTELAHLVELESFEYHEQVSVFLKAFDEQRNMPF